MEHLPSEHYARLAIENLIVTSLVTAKSYWKNVFDRWVATEEYKKIQALFEPARAAAEDDYYNGGNTAEVVGRELLAANIELLPAEVLNELKALYIA